MDAGTEQAVGVMRDAARVLRSPVASLGEEVKALDQVIKAAEAAVAVRLGEMEATKVHELEGASSIAVWARREIGQDASVTRSQVKAAATMRELPEVAKAARAGRVGLRHLESFTYALAHIDADTVRDRETDMVAAAVGSTPRDFHERVRRLRFRLYPDDLDKAYLKGMDKRDIKLAKTLGGWHVTGFLDIETGAKFDTLLRNQSVPREADDTRTASERRMDGLQLWLDRTLAHGLPSDNGIRPHLMVTVTSEALQNLAKPDAALEGTIEPAVLHGFGPIGPVLLSVLLDDAEVTPILIKQVEPNPEVLDVGRSHRRATPRQATAIWVRQGGVCASPGCHHPIGHNHHKHWYSNGGHTRLDDMDGRCTKCHAHIHAQRLAVPGYTKDGWPEHLAKHRRTG
jgi:hypothetical protein